MAATEGKAMKTCPTCGHAVSARKRRVRGGLAFPKPQRIKGRGCRVSDRDEAEKVRRGYTNPRSYVRRDGSEMLYGEDWRKRKQEVWERGGGRCEKIVSEDYLTMDMRRCRNEMHDPHHRVTRGKKRDDRASNLIGLCRLHHDLEDERKPRFSH